MLTLQNLGSYEHLRSRSEDKQVIAVCDMHQTLKYSMMVSSPSPCKMGCPNARFSGGQPNVACSGPRRHFTAAAPIRQQRRGSRRESVRALQCKAASALENNTLKVIVQGRNVKLTEALREFAEEKVSKALSKFGHAIKEVDVNLSVHGGKRGRVADEQQKCEVTIYTLRNGVVRAEDIEESLYAAIEKVTDIVSRKMRKVKEKAISKGKWEGKAGPRGHSAYKELPEDIASDEEDIDLDALAPSLPQEVVRTKTLGLRPMTREEALEQVEQVGHSFFIFRDVNDTIKVIYKRKMSGYGIIAPQFID